MWAEDEAEEPDGADGANPAAPPGAGVPGTAPRNPELGGIYTPLWIGYGRSRSPSSCGKGWPVETPGG